VCSWVRLTGCFRNLFIYGWDEPQLMKHIGKVLKGARLARRLTADEVGAAMSPHLSRSRIYQFGKSRFVLPKNLRYLSKVLRIPLSTLQAENGRPKKRKARSPEVIARQAATLRAYWKMVRSAHRS
jgi:hypothetical protein